MDGALLAIRYAREQKRPFLGTCGGFQHAIIEYARNVLGWADADPAETAPDAARPVIAPLQCALPLTRPYRAPPEGAEASEIDARFGAGSSTGLRRAGGPFRFRGRINSLIPFYQNLSSG